MPVKILIITCKTSIVQTPPFVTGTKKNSTLSTIKQAFTIIKVDFLPNLLVMGTASATPTILLISPMVRNSPAKSSRLTPRTGMVSSYFVPSKSVKKNATVEPRTVLNRLLHNAAPIISHQGLLRTSILRSFPTDTFDTVCRCSFVRRKQRINNTNTPIATHIIADCHPLAES